MLIELHTVGMITAVSWHHAVRTVLDSMPPVPHLPTSFAVLFFYETIVTLDREIESFWSKGFSSGAVLFFLNKYMRLVYFAGSVLPLSDTTGLFTDKVRHTTALFATAI